jgi:hypothetical protein
MTLICNNCFKHYKRRDYYNNHITLCKIINDRKLENENDKTPTCTELYSMIKDMGNKYTTLLQQNKSLNNEISKLKNILFKKTENVNIISKSSECIDWLQNNHEKTENLINWMTIQELDTNVFNNFINTDNFVRGISDIIVNLCSNNYKTTPFYVFKEKKDTLFAFENDNWKILEKDSLINCIQNIQKKLIQNFTQWQCENMSKITESAYYSDNYNKYLQLIIGENIYCNDNYSKIKNNIFERLINLE